MEGNMHQARRSHITCTPSLDWRMEGNMHKEISHYMFPSLDWRMEGNMHQARRSHITCIPSVVSLLPWAELRSKLVELPAASRSKKTFWYRVCTEAIFTHWVSKDWNVHKAMGDMSLAHHKGRLSTFDCKGNSFELYFSIYPLTRLSNPPPPPATLIYK